MASENDSDNSNGPVMSPKDTSSHTSKRLGNFGEVIPGKIYRSQYPIPEQFESLARLKLKTILTLVDTPVFPEYEAFLQTHGINHLVSPVGKNKSEVGMRVEEVLPALLVLLDEANYPILVHCNQGRHRTGCVVACLQLVLGDSLEQAYAVYHQYAREKSRPLDSVFIASFPETELVRLRKRLELPGSAAINNTATTTTNSTASSERPLLRSCMIVLNCPN